MSKNLIACRIASYGKFEHRAWSHLPQIGVRHVEINAPEPADLEAIRRKLADHALSASSVQSGCDLDQDNARDVIKPQLEACAALGARISFAAMKSIPSPPGAVWDRLRAIGDLAQELGVTVAIESHPELCTNAQVMRATMDAVDHPHIRVNFDTANVSYYNDGATAVGELSGIIDAVAAVHIKDYAGGFKRWDFPVLGQGIVDFPAVFSMMAQRGFTGPYTIELEGTEGVEMDEPGQCRYVADSVAYLKSIGVFEE